MTELTVRTATTADLNFLQDQTERLVQSKYDWDHHLGSESNSICLIAQEDGESVGHLLITPGNELTTVIKLGEGGDIRWWKLQSLAVEPESEGQGLASMLLEKGRARVPSSVPGLYGNIVIDHHPDVATWYRSKGFRVSVQALLRNMPSSTD